MQRYLYKKESQFLQQLYKDCYQSKETKDNKETPEQCHQKYNENLQLIKEDLTQYLQEKASELWLFKRREYFVVYWLVTYKELKL